jgi:proline racemase
MQIGDHLTGVSIIGSEFQGKILGTSKVGNINAIKPQISGRGWVTGTHQHFLDPSDPWPEGYKVGDTWPITH